MIQSRIDQLAQTNQNVAFLNLMSTFRLQVNAMATTDCGRGLKMNLLLLPRPCKCEQYVDTC